MLLCDTVLPFNNSLLQDPVVLQQQVHDMEASLSQMRRECSRAVATAQAIVGRPTTPLGSPRTSEDGTGLCSVELVVRQLVAKLTVNPCKLECRLT